MNVYISLLYYYYLTLILAVALVSDVLGLDCGGLRVIHSSQPVEAEWTS